MTFSLRTAFAAIILVVVVIGLSAPGTTEAKVTGKYTLKLSTFGIKPIQVMGGMVSVKDDIQLEFESQLKETRWQKWKFGTEENFANN